MAIYIKTGTRDKLARLADQGGGFLQVAVLTTNNFELVEPDPEVRKSWVELCEKEGKQ